MMKNAKAFEQMQKLMELRGFAKATQKAYLGAIRQLASFYPVSFDEMGCEHVREFLLHAINVRKLSSQYINTTYSGIKFLFEVALTRDWNMKHIPRIKKKESFLKPFHFMRLRNFLTQFQI